MNTPIGTPAMPEAPVVAARRLHRIGIVGCGVMGAGLAEICARAGTGVLVNVSSDESEARGRTRIERSLAAATRRGKLTATDAEAVRSRISFTTDIGELADRQLVFEAVPENEAAKLQVFRALDKIVSDPGAVFASNTSSLPVIKLARATERPGRVLGVHFFNPAPVLPLVEVISSLLTDASASAVTEAFVTDVLGKTVIRSGDRAGFVVNALLVPYLLAAIRMLESGFATAEDIDTGMKLGCSHPMGPLALVDLIGLDTIAAVGRALYDEFREPAYAVPPLLARMVEGGLLGTKTGRGFYTYA
ncbi:3-hydroxybutyryl-CoA dehydrogenase [Streptacidiphilus sp. EB103A]|uniref:3-hydroxybutyryl-CoA dehydrogenase n=1 Tax=Streptacidiphilus sp. EB103A TaxID=3156275 RepID=UPI0035151272